MNPSSKHAVNEPSVMTAGGQAAEMFLLFSILSQHIVGLTVQATVFGPHLSGDVSLA